MKRIIASILFLGCSTAQALPVTYAVEGIWDSPAPSVNTFFASYTYDSSVLTHTTFMFDFNSGTGGFSIQFVGDSFIESLGWDALRVTGSVVRGPGFGTSAWQAWDYDRPGTGALELNIAETGEVLSLRYSDNEISYDALNNISLIPLPAAVWLFGSGLGLLGWFRKRSV